MAKVLGYNIKIGGLALDQQMQGRDCQLENLVTRHDLSVSGGHCYVSLLGKKSVLPKLGDPVNIKLGFDGKQAEVFTGKVDRVKVSAWGMNIYASDGMKKLMQHDVTKVYEKVSADKIIKDLLGKAKLSTGTIDRGPKFPSYVLHKGITALGHLRYLAKLMGAEVFTDYQGKVHVRQVKPQSAKYKIDYLQQVLRLEVDQKQPVYNGVELVGEGSASAKGADYYYWLVKDNKTVTDKAKNSKGIITSGAGSFAYQYINGAIRSKQVATDLSQAYMRKLAEQDIYGYIDMIGNPDIGLNQYFKIERIPIDQALSKHLIAYPAIRIKAVQHQLNFTCGFTTRLEF